MVNLPPAAEEIALIQSTPPSTAFAEFMAWALSPAAFAGQVRGEDTRAEALFQEERRAMRLQVQSETDVSPGAS